MGEEEGRWGKKRGGREKKRGGGGRRGEVGEEEGR